MSEYTDAHTDALRRLLAVVEELEQAGIVPISAGSSSVQGPLVQLSRRDVADAMYRREEGRQPCTEEFTEHYYHDRGVRVYWLTPTGED
jgi:hypothetical protein